MPQTRDQRCTAVLRNFFEQENILGEFHYELKKLTHRGWKFVRYEIEIPQTWFMRYPRYNSNYNELIWTEEEHGQIIPNEEHINIVLDKFKEKFEPFEKNIRRAYGTKLSSFLRITGHSINESHVKLYVNVQYNKDEIPFPEDFDYLARARRLESENESLRNTIRDFKHETDKANCRLRRDYFIIIRQRDNALNFINNMKTDFNKKTTSFIMNYQTIINNQYKELNKNFDCPVCFISIENDKTYTTPCNHVFCESCATQCNNKCPLCRQEMCLTI
tara:strand:+ start:209 stop:1033 length:825 start_codon:yes stop_codon:yes gene_type:complete